MTCRLHFCICFLSIAPCGTGSIPGVSSYTNFFTVPPHVEKRSSQKARESRSSGSSTIFYGGNRASGGLAWPTQNRDGNQHGERRMRGTLEMLKVCREKEGGWCRLVCTLTTLRLYHVLRGTVVPCTSFAIGVAKQSLTHAPV